MGAALFDRRPGFPEPPFTDLAAARAWVQGLERWYDGEHRHSAWQCVTPDPRHRGEDADLLARRQVL